MPGLIGVDIGGTNIKAALIQGGRITRRRRIPTNAHQGVAAVINQIARAIDGLGKKAAVGVGIAGLIDSERGIVRFSPNLRGWHNVPLARLLTQRTGVRVKLTNDVNAITLGEWKFGAGRGARNMFCFTLGTGVGGGIVANGELVTGRNNMAGEFGHMTIDHVGRACKCGNTGCLERYVGAEYIVALAKKMMRGKKTVLKRFTKLTPRIIAVAARRDHVARAVFARVGAYIGAGLVNIIHLLDPEVVVITGGISRAGRILLDPIKDVLEKRAMSFAARGVKLVRGKLGDDAGVLGAAYFAEQSLATKP